MIQPKDLQVELDTLVKLALREDLATAGDISSQGVFDGELGTARIIAREGSVVYGLWVLDRIVQTHGEGLTFIPLVHDGDFVEPGTVLCRFTGPVTRILALERTFLNFFGFLSGIATRTSSFVTLSKQYGSTIILDTRKTLPGYRLLSKAAVLAGGGSNHRMGLYDMVMLKDNHIDAAGSIEKAVSKIRTRYGSLYRIEVECRTLVDVETALGLSVDVAMLDNMGPEACAEAVILRKSKFPKSQTAFEASGDMSLERLPLYAGLGLEYISVGSLTHSVKTCNFSLGME